MSSGEHYFLRNIDCTIVTIHVKVDLQTQTLRFGTQLPIVLDGLLRLSAVHPNIFLSEYLYNPLRNMVVRLLPFDLGYWIASFFIDSFRREFIATKRRDEYIGKMISKAQYGIDAGEENTGWFQSLLL